MPPALDRAAARRQPAKTAKTAKTARTTNTTKTAGAPARTATRAAKVAGGSGGDDFLSDVTFASLPVQPATLRAVQEVLGYQRLSKPQSYFLPALLAQPASDAFVKATTGSGKTLGFLIPVLEALYAHAAPSAVAGVRALVLSPSRELALQTRQEAVKLLTFHAGCDAVAVIGGTDKRQDVRALHAATGARQPCIVVATPGRLEDLLEDAAVRARVLGGLRIVVLDEADRLLDMGFVHAIRRILAARPPSVAQACRTLMLTATVGPGVMQVATQFLRPGYATIDTVELAHARLSPSARAKVAQQQADQSHITQRAVLAPPTSLHTALLAALQRRRQADPTGHKVIVFFPSNAMVEFYAALFKERFAVPVLMLTGGLPQRQREAATTRFRDGAAVTMFASDVAGRGMDFPGITCVLQVGAAKPEVYKQRVGRTGRGGARGEAVIVLGTDEARLLDTLRRAFPIEMEADSGPQQALPAVARAPLTGALAKLASAAFRGTLGAYNSEVRGLGWTKQQLVDAIAARFRGAGLQQWPQIPDKTLAKMGLAGVQLPH